MMPFLGAFGLGFSSCFIGFINTKIGWLLFCLKIKDEKLGQSKK